MVVLSLFDGISCGQVALERAGIKVDMYLASEIDSDAINITMKNYPNTIQLGDVRHIRYDGVSGTLFFENGEVNVGHIDLLIGGSPCTDFSKIGTQKGMISDAETPEQIVTLEQYLNLKNSGVSFQGQSYLFWEYIRLLTEIKPTFFLLENVKMSNKWLSIVNAVLGTNPIEINSSLFSAQYRQRLYWTNIDVKQLQFGKDICISDILDQDASTKDVSYTMTVRRRIPQIIKKYNHMPVMFNPYNRTEIKDKSCTLSTGSMITSSCATLMFTKVKNGKYTVKNHKIRIEALNENDDMIICKTMIDLPDGTYNIRKLSVIEAERLQTLSDNYTYIENCCDSKRYAVIGNGWTVDVIAYIFNHINKKESHKK